MPAHAAVNEKDQMNKDEWSGPVLEVDSLRTEFHLRHATARAVDTVSFSVRRGECLGLVGESATSQLGRSG
jgi:ABC-type glutathione transport system ATPase component